MGRILRHLRVAIIHLDNAVSHILRVEINRLSIALVFIYVEIRVGYYGLQTKSITMLLILLASYMGSSCIEVLTLCLKIPLVCIIVGLIVLGTAAFAAATQDSEDY